MANNLKKIDKLNQYIAELEKERRDILTKKTHGTAEKDHASLQDKIEKAREKVNDLVKKGK